MLTVKELQKLKPKNKPFEVLDGDGLNVTVRSTGSLSFNLRFTGTPANRAT